MSELTLFDVADTGLCEYGMSSPTYRGGGSICSEPVTHVAHGVWTRGDESGHTVARCCRTHANYYADAWVPLCVRLGFDGGTRPDAAWIEILPSTGIDH